MNRVKKVTGIAGVMAVLLAAGIGAWGGCLYCPSGVQAVQAEAPAAPLRSGSLRLMEWNENLAAVRYEVEILPRIPADLSRNAPHPSALYDDSHIYSPGLLLDLDTVIPGYSDKPLYWRVRSIDLDGNPISDFSAPSPLQQPIRPLRDAPIPRAALG